MYKLSWTDSRGVKREIVDKPVKVLKLLGMLLILDNKTVLTIVGLDNALPVVKEKV